MKKSVLIILLVGLIIAIVAMAYVFRPSITSVEDANSDLAMGSVELYTTYSMDEAGSDSLYVDKILEVTGIAISVVSDSIVTTVTLEGDESGGVICTFNDLPIAKLPKVGNEYVIKGKCTGFLMDVNMVLCSLVE